MQPARRRRLLKVLLGIAVLAAVLWAGTFAAVVWLVLDEPDVGRVPFDAAAWRATPSEHSHESLRLRMVDDLLEAHSPIGRMRAEVVGLLGEPPETGYFEDWDLVWHLGAERSAFAIDPEWLVMRLDDADVVREARLVTD